MSTRAAAVAWRAVNQLLSHSPAETEALGEAWGRAARPGLVVILTGELGAGKTALARGVARGLGFAGRVHSPTFTLVNVYSGGRLPLVHLDLYRIETPEQLRGAGLAEYISPDGVAVIEWGERWFAGTGMNPGEQTRPLRRATLEILDEHARRVTYEDFGA